MATFVLVHGAHAGGWVWQATARFLRSKGHEVYTPTLTGLGEREHLATPQVGLVTHITDVTNLLIYEDLKNVILVGHGYGGMVITGTAGRVSEHIIHLVYMDAYLPQSGQSASELAGPKMAHEAIAAAMGFDGYRLPPPPGDSRLTPMLLKPCQDALVIERPRAVTQLRHTFIYFTRDKISPEPAFTPIVDAAARVRQDLIWGFSELPLSHNGMIDDPALVAQRLLELV